MCCFFFNDTATTEIYTLSLHDALPICRSCADLSAFRSPEEPAPQPGGGGPVRVQVARVDAARDEAFWPAARELPGDRKSTRLNSSHANISYAVFCLKKKTCTRRRRYIL